MITQAGLCEGYGTLAVADVLGAELAWYSEIDPAACAVLAHHHPTLPNHGDLTEADWAHAERVDIITGGWPCQPWSLAGKRKGVLDERAIWPHIARAVRALRPRLVFLENVASIAPAGELARAAGDLAALGYVGSWRRVRASDVGAPHQRARIFICAWPAGDTALLGRHSTRAAGYRPDHQSTRATGGSGRTAANSDSRAVRQQPVTLAGRSDTTVSGRTRQTAADATRDGRGEGRPEPARLIGGSDAAQRGHAATNPAGPGRGDVRLDVVIECAEATGCGETTEPRRGDQHPDWAGYAPAVKRWEHITGRRAPDPTVLGKRGGRQLSSRFTEWLMGLPDGWVTDVPGISRNAQLKLCGNGVVPQQAAYALRLMLMDQAGERAT